MINENRPLAVGDRVAFDLSEWETDGPRVDLGTVVRFVSEPDDLDHVIVLWDEGYETTELPNENEWIFLVRDTAWYWNYKVYR